jgi:hypothetical protein
LFLKVLAASHLAAFGSYWAQAGGLTGPGGIVPAGRFLEVVRQAYGRKAWFEAPSLCWIVGAHPGVGILCGVGVLLSLILLMGYAEAPCLAALWALYLSLTTVGQVFYGYQWDSLLLETTLVALFLVPWTLGRAREPWDPPLLARALVWWLLFRLMFLSGAVKLASGDPTWRNLTALAFHYETQPLPSPFAWYAHQLPLGFQRASCALMFAVELAAPLCIPLPRRVRHPAVVSMIGLQVLIALTGSYAFFNLLSIGLCLACIDDEAWARLGRRAPAEAPKAGPGTFQRVALRWFAAFSVGITFIGAVARFDPGTARSPIARDLLESVDSLRSWNSYGLFAVMTVERPELIIEGSDDRIEWKEYPLPYKPGDLARRPSWAAPYQPRLDWQLWFAALEPPDENRWLRKLGQDLLRGEPAALGLFRENPFPGHPPRYLRVVRYLYGFTDWDERRRTGNWWRRTPIDFYIDEMSLDPETL